MREAPEHALDGVIIRECECLLWRSLRRRLRLPSKLENETCRSQVALQGLREHTPRQGDDLRYLDDLFALLDLNEPRGLPCQCLLERRNALWPAFRVAGLTRLELVGLRRTAERLNVPFTGLGCAIESDREGPELGLAEVIDTDHGDVGEVFETCCLPDHMSVYNPPFGIDQDGRADPVPGEAQPDPGQLRRRCLADPPTSGLEALDLHIVDGQSRQEIIAST